MLEVNGEKRFKPREQQRDQSAGLDFAEAEREFRRLTTTTNYAQAFGARPKLQADSEILRHKRLSELPIASVLRPEAAASVEKWLCASS